MKNPILLCFHFEIGDSAVKYWEEYRIVNAKNIPKYNMEETLHSVECENDDLSYSDIVDKALNELAIPFGYFNKLPVSIIGIRHYYID